MTKWVLIKNCFFKRHNRVKVLKITRIMLEKSRGEFKTVVSGFTISVYGSSCNSLVFGFSLFLFASPMQHGKPKYRFIKKKRENETKKGELHELPAIEIVKPGTLRLTSGLTWPPFPPEIFARSLAVLQLANCDNCRKGGAWSLQIILQKKCFA